MDWKKFFDSIGLNGTWWQWRIALMQKRWHDFTTDFRTRSSNVSYSHRNCRACGSLMDRDATVCSRCGTRLENWRQSQLRRAASLFIPGGLTVTYLLMAANVIAMGLMMIGFGWNNLFSPTSAALVFSGGFVPEFIFEGQWWRMLSYAFLHGGIIHIFFNLYSLSQVGPIAEKDIGPSRLLVVYILAAIGGAGADLLWHHLFGTRPLVIGASGAIFGLIGFGLTYNHFYGSTAGRYNSRIYLRWALYSFAVGFLMTGVDNVCHTGGFIVGALMGFLIERDQRHGNRLELLWKIVATTCVFLTVAALIFALLGAVHYLKSGELQ